MVENITAAEIDDKFLEQARMNIQEAQAILICPPATYFLTHAERNGAIVTAISLIKSQEERSGDNRWILATVKRIQPHG